MARIKPTETADAKEAMETPETKISKHPDTKIAVETDSFIVFQAVRKLEAHEYELLAAWIRNENTATGLKIVLAPHSVSVKVGGASGDNA